MTGVGLLVGCLFTWLPAGLLVRLFVCLFVKVIMGVLNLLREFAYFLTLTELVCGKDVYSPSCMLVSLAASFVCLSACFIVCLSR